MYLFYLFIHSPEAINYSIWQHDSSSNTTISVGSRHWKRDLTTMGSLLGIWSRRQGATHNCSQTSMSNQPGFHFEKALWKNRCASGFRSFRYSRKIENYLKCEPFNKGKKITTSSLLRFLNTAVFILLYRENRLVFIVVFAQTFFFRFFCKLQNSTLGFYCPEQG